MSNNQSDPCPLKECLLAIVLGFLAYGGLTIATGRLPWLWLKPPEIVRIEPYVLLYSFLGSVAYLLSSLLSEYKLLSDEEKRLTALKKENEALKAMAENSKKEVPRDLERNITELDVHLQEFKNAKFQMLEIWVKLARIPFGMIMAAIFYLLAAQLVTPDLLDALGDNFLAGGAFVVAFFPKVMMEGLNGLADRLLGRSSASVDK